MKQPLPIDGSGQMFDLIARRYDLVNRIISFGADQRWRARCVDALGLSDDRPCTVVDLATGTGDLAIQIATRFPHAHVLGIDPSSEMLDLARQKVAARGLRSVALETGDARALPLGTAIADATCMAFGIRNIPDRARALREMARITRPNGCVAILELAEPPPGPVGALARAHVHRVVPTVGAWLSGEPQYRYLARSIEAFPSPERFCELLSQNNLRVRSVTPMMFGACVLYLAEPRGEA